MRLCSAVPHYAVGVHVCRASFYSSRMPNRTLPASGQVLEWVDYYRKNGTYTEEQLEEWIAGLQQGAVDAGYSAEAAAGTGDVAAAAYGYAGLSPAHASWDLLFFPSCCLFSSCCTAVPISTVLDFAFSFQELLFCAHGGLFGRRGEREEKSRRETTSEREKGEKGGEREGRGGGDDTRACHCAATRLYAALAFFHHSTRLGFDF
jgi:hypothetical protein